MRRVLVVGCAGAGKSTFARRLAHATGLPVIHLDRHYWRPGWVEPDKEHWASRVGSLVAGPGWIIEGNYGGTLPARLARADTVIHLDMPRRLCLWRVLRRTTLQYGRTREDMTEDCPERFDLPFLRYVWDYRRRHRPILIGALRNFQGTLVTLRDPATVERYLSALPKAAPNLPPRRKTPEYY
jgi:adenylate kinase family enzyme